VTGPSTGGGSSLRGAERALPEPDEPHGRPGLGFLIAHQGRTGDYVVAAWWDHENELPLRVLVRRGRTGRWRRARRGESFCVWDLEVIWAERRAWIDTMLSPGGAGRDGWLASVDERFRGDRLPAGAPVSYRIRPMRQGEADTCEARSARCRSPTSRTAGRDWGS